MRRSRCRLNGRVLGGRGLGREGRGHVSHRSTQRRRRRKEVGCAPALARMTRTMADTASLRPELEGALVAMRPRRR
jgi:hypothetical protein